MLGSLQEFFDGVNKTVQMKHKNIQQDELMSPISKYSQKRMIQSRKKRTMSGVENYKAADKSLLFSKFAKNYPQVERAQKSYTKVKQIQIVLPERRKISQSRISSLFYGNNPLKMKEQIAKQQLKRQHNLLRAIVRTKQNEQQKVANTDYEDSFNRMAVNLKKIKLTSVFEDQRNKNSQPQPKTNRSLQIQTNKTAKNQLDNQTRIQFENCLSWTKRRKKDGSFYAQKLGKNMKIQTNNDSIVNRKSMLQFIHTRSESYADSYTT